MDGATLLDSLSDWTLESHPNVSTENRRHTNELFSELKTELLTLLGTNSQVGGSNNTESDANSNITVFQPMDEKILAGLSADDIDSRLALVESNANRW